MDIIYKNGDVFSHGGFLAHCIATDLRMGRGIAVQMNNKFGLRKELERFSQAERSPGSCIFVSPVFNLITKSLSVGKPTKETFSSSLHAMAELFDVHQIDEVAMPRIGCGLDRLDWSWVEGQLRSVFSHVDGRIIVFTLGGERR